MVKLNNFKRSDFACSCCGKEKMKDNTLLKLQAARTIADVPFIISSGYRCNKHNVEVGGKSSSSHLGGYAVDMVVDGSRARFKILDALRLSGFNRIGVGKNFIHIDNDPEKSGNVIWLY